VWEEIQHTQRETNVVRKEGMKDGEVGGKKSWFKKRTKRRRGGGPKTELA